ncbi:60S ribosomal protein L26-1 [Verticillium dahliae VDG1]|nr:60S ribosomal protein L26-1 [Verticillium dahliae VDG1]
MLSSPSRNLQARQRATHRRQNSTPSAFEPAKIPALPTHVLREAQQQRILARPGPHQQNLSRSHTRHLSHHHQQQQQHPLRRQQHQQQNFMAAANDHDNGYVMSPHGTPQHQRFGAACFDNSSSPVPFNPYQGGGINVMVPMKDDPAFVGAMMNDKDFDLFGADADLSSPAFMDFNESPTSAQPIWAPEGDAAAATLRRTTRRISNGILDRVAKFETMGGEPSRPITPPHQNGNGYFPPTPMETPHDRIVKQQPEQASRPSRFSDDYDESMEETLKPVRGKPTSRAQNVFEEMRRRAEESSANPTPPQTTTMPEAQTFESQVSAADFITMNSFDTDYLKTQSFDGLTDDLGVSPGIISGINIEETKTETGVTTDDIAIYIQGPDPADNKWMCLFEDCGKKFGRKENIKSHVQTHLNDRQYQCPSCHKCFKVVKRGRPRKHRPEMDERVNKSARTRSKNQSISSISSQSGYSDTSGANSPENYNPISDNDFAAMTMDIKQEQQHARHARPMPFETVSMSSAPIHVSSFVSPEEIMDHPSVHSHHDASPTKSTPSQYNTPPELSQSSSPPPHHFFDAEPGSVSFADDSLLAGMRTSSAGGLGSAGNLSGLGLGDHDEELLMKAFDDNLGAFDRDPNVLMMSDFDDAVDMFTNGDDVFFGTS